eukprot:TRINITY_DN2893_c0_g1_i5.p2 TRINITY_DN2893_c0_g1~~TRINITY_DN2893_c0_g1_i5.p2  ORF type:complete len:273 (+),score=41.56 TRINITY_DN2893_c0_g1_i5:1545-2363(+)
MFPSDTQSQTAGAAILPGFSFPCTSLALLPEERLKSEFQLGHDPVVWYRKYVAAAGQTPPLRADVDRSSTEFGDVCTVFLSSESRFYYPKSAYSMSSMLKRSDIKVERIQNGGQENAFQKMLETIRKELNQAGSDVIPGVHIRWAFHGTNSAEVLDVIVEGDRTGFDVAHAGVGIWGKGCYFARDPEYCVHAGFGLDCKQDGYKMLILCLVVVGVPTLGEKFLDQLTMPFLTKKVRHRSTVDDMSSPELFCLPNNNMAYPAYVIHFPEHIGL